MKAWLASFFCAAAIAVTLPVSAQSIGSHIRKRSDKKHQLSSLESNRALLAMDDVTACFADSYTLRTRDVLALPFASPEQIEEAKGMFVGANTCLENGYTLRVDISHFVASLAENMAEKDLNLRRRKNPGRLDVAVVQGLSPEAAPSEVFGTCVVNRAPNRVVRLLAVPPGDDDEFKKMSEMADLYGSCMPAGTQVALDPRSLRAALSVGLYRTAEAMRAEKES